MKNCAVVAAIRLGQRRSGEVAKNRYEFMLTYPLRFSNCPGCQLQDRVNQSQICEEL
jgi:hypothetical protein